MSEVPPKLCKDCRWSSNVGTFGFIPHQCLAPQNTENDLVTGGIKIRPDHFSFCTNVRATEASDLCGPSGKWFTPKKTWKEWFLGTK